MGSICVASGFVIFDGRPPSQGFVRETGISRVLNRPGFTGGFTPHVGIGLFAKPASRYDISTAPEDCAFDESRYNVALKRAEAAEVDVRCHLRELDLVEVRDSVFEWARGTRPAVPDDRARTRQKLALGQPASG